MGDRSNLVFPACKIATLDELRVTLNFMVNYAGISFDLTSNQTLELHFHTGCAIKKIELPIQIAQVLGLLRRDGVLPLSLRIKYQGRLKLLVKMEKMLHYPRVLFWLYNV